MARKRVRKALEARLQGELKGTPQALAPGRGKGGRAFPIQSRPDK